MHILLQDDGTRKTPQETAERQFLTGHMTYDELQAQLDTIAVERGEACERCHTRAVKVIAAGERLCMPCYRVRTRR